METAIGQAITAAIEKEHEPTPKETAKTVKADAAAILKAAAKLAPQWGPVECSAAGGSVSEKYGRKFIAAIKCLVPIPALGVVVETAMFGNLKVTAEETSVTFTASLPKSIKALNAESRDRFLAHVENSAAKWKDYEKVTDDAASELLGRKRKSVAGERPRLVKQVKVDQSGQKQSVA